MTSERVIFRYLDMLRESGKTNMFDAVPYLVKAFNITKYDAQRHLVKWMETFESEKIGAKNRVKKSELES